MSVQLYYLGPRGSFTYQAAQEFSHQLKLKSKDCVDVELVAVRHERDIFTAVERGDGYGVIAWENNVEGYVAQNLDKLIDSYNVLGIARLSIDVEFDAFVQHNHDELTEVTAHPHGLAQCSDFAKSHHLTQVPSSSNAAACEHVKSHQVALAPHGCGELYGLELFESCVQDYKGAHTDFLLLSQRKENVGRDEDEQESWCKSYESVITVIPLSTGPGVVANLLDVFRDNGLNMTSLISRPVKGVNGTYSFIITLDSAPHNAVMRSVMNDISAHGDWLKVLAVYPARDIVSLPVEQWNLPQRGLNPVLEEKA
ncbi:prephenate dehydratase [Alloscardovia venturai]|uniref:Prephenate dehydratase n=1 Tax=Alloscardovia venturai TaxID=1769421 RepID=A0ABW2Y777_9BIFI